MLEINLKAKPFHPCESLLGVELFHMCRRCSLIGTAYISPKIECDRLDILVNIKPHVGLNAFMKKLKQTGWKDQDQPNQGLGEFYQYCRAHDDKLLLMYVSPGVWQYDMLMLAQEACKYLSSFEPHKKLDKLLVKEVHNIIMKGHTVGTNADGQFTHLNPAVVDHLMADEAMAAPQALPVPGAWAAEVAQVQAGVGQQLNVAPQGIQGAQVLQNVLNILAGGNNNNA